MNLRYRNFDLNQMFEQRLSYERHRKKVKELSSSPGANFNVFPEWAEMIHKFKDTKRITFLKEIRSKNQAIHRSNMKIFQKLSSSHEISRLTPESPNFYPATARKEDSFRRRKLSETREHENERMQIRIKSLVSSINSRKMSEQYKRSKQIRNRIMRYETNPLTHRVTPKAQRFMSNMNSSKLSVKSSESKKSQSKNAKSIVSKLNQSQNLSKQENRQKLVQTARESFAEKRQLRRKKLLNVGERSEQFHKQQDFSRELYSRQENDSNQNAMFPTQFENRRKPQTAHISSRFKG